MSSIFVSKNIKTKIDRIKILSFVLYGSETWSLPILREKRRLKMFENRVLRSTSGAKREEVTGNWRRLHMTILFTKFYSGDQIQKNELG